MMKGATLGEKICAAVLSEQLGISMDLAWKNYIRGIVIDPSWLEVGEYLLRSNIAKLGAACVESGAPAAEEPPAPGRAQ